MHEHAQYPPIGDYALLADCHSAALVSKRGSIDWCCMPRFDAGSLFGRMLDWNKGGYCAVAPSTPDFEVTRSYLDATLVLETTFEGEGGAMKVTDLMAMRQKGAHHPRNQIIRKLEGTSGSVEVTLEIVARFDYGDIKPWVREEGDGVFSLIGGDEAFVVWSDAAMEVTGSHDLTCSLEIAEGEHRHLSLTFTQPHVLADDSPDPLSASELDERIEETIEWWRTWSGKAELDGPYGDAELRSAIVLKSMSNAPTGAIVAAPTTSLPEQPGGSLNWDYRYSWARDSSFTVRSLAVLGYEAEADGFRRFMERSSAGHADDLQIMYGIYGERRLDESELGDLEGYRRARPVRVGNGAAKQTQLDVYGELVNLAWLWTDRGHPPEKDYWDFLVTLIDTAAERWSQPDAGVWESRGDPQHYVVSKAMCWAALDRGVRLAERSSLDAPVERWRLEAERVRASIETNGVDPHRGVYVKAYWRTEMDASLLLLPRVGYVAWDDKQMLATIDAVREELDADGKGLLYRETRPPEAREGAFLCCSFWLAEALARGGRLQEAREVFAHTVGTANDVGLFSEEYDVESGEMLGNFPLALTHLSHIAAAVALAESGA